MPNWYRLFVCLMILPFGLLMPMPISVRVIVLFASIAGILGALGVLTDFARWMQKRKQLARERRAIEEAARVDEREFQYPDA